MQVRKRAKSVSFGKSPKEKEEPKKVLSHAAEKVDEVIEKKVSESVNELSLAAKKVEDYETVSSVPTEPVQEASSEGIVKEPVAPQTTITPSSEFVTDATNSEAATVQPVSSEVSTADVVTPQLSEEKKSDVVAPASVESVSPPVEQKTSSENPELSATPPSSAFTLQEGGGESVASGTSKKHVFFYFLLIAFISFMLGLVAMAAINYFGWLPKQGVQMPIKNNLLENIKIGSPSPTASVQPTTVPTAVPTAKPVDAKAYKLSVLNGSGVKGKAAEVKTTLTEAGFTVIYSGNADRSDYTTTQIAAKKSVPKELLDKLGAELDKQFTIDTVSIIPADSAQSADVIVTLGQGK